MAAEQLSVELVAEFVGRDAFEALKREVAQIKNSMSGLGQVQDQVRKQTDAAAGAVRQQRQAFAQTGMQINQFAGQVAAGTPVMTAFVQQIGDVAYVIGQAGSAGGKLAAFLSGPWGAAILIAISVLGPLISKLWESKDAAQSAQSAFSKYIASLSTASKVSDVFTENAKSIALAKGKVAQLNAELAQLSIAGVEFKGEASYAAATSAREARIAVIKKELGINNNLIKQKNDEIQRTIQLSKLEEKRTSTLEKLHSNRIQEQKDARAAAAEYKRSQKEAEKLADIQKQITLEKSVMLIKDAQDFTNAMTKMGDEASKAIDRTAADVLQNTMMNMADQFAAAKKEIDDAVYQGADKIKSMSESMGQAFSDGIKGMITGAMSFKNVMSNVIDSVINKLFDLFVVQQITGMISKGLSAITGITLPGKAIGGPVQSGKAYMVGERGPEMFVPSRSGSIVPNGGMGNAINISVDARGASDPAAVRMQVEQGIAQAAPYIIAAAQNRTMKAASRPRLPGTIG
jgi:hypothetical protein